MLRVLKPGGTLAFATWPPDHAVGKMFALVGKHAPPLPPGASPSSQWGDVAIVRERLGNAVRDITFDRETMLVPAMSLPHYREMIERTAGPVLKLVQAMQSDPRKLATFRAELEGVMAPYYGGENNVIRQSYLLTRATKL